MSECPRGWYSRGYLPHIDAGAVPQFVTWRLADSMPRQIYERIKSDCTHLPEGERKREIYRAVEIYLDSCAGECVLRDPRAAKIVQDALIYYHENKYSLHAWVVMPNHVHVLFTPMSGVQFGRVIGSIKSYSAKIIHEIMGRSGQLWQDDFFDRVIRDE